LISKQSAVQHNSGKRFVKSSFYSEKSFADKVTRKPRTASKRLKNLYNLSLPADLGSKELLMYLGD
jgi:hypothetical protein